MKVREIIKRLIEIDNITDFRYNGSMNLNVLLEEKKITKYQLRNITGIPYSTLSDLLNGKTDFRSCPLEMAFSLAKALSLSVEDFYRYGTQRQPLPSSLYPAFWDTDLKALDMEKNKNFIICRLYVKGGMEGMFFAERNYSYYEIREAAKKRRDLNPIVANYLRQLYHLKKEEMKYYSVPHDIWRR